jgi:hypothetical protein
VVGQLVESVLYGVFQGFFEVLIHLGDEFGISLLDGVLTLNEHLLVDFDQFLVNHVHGVLVLSLVASEFTFLDIDEQWKLIKSFLDLSKSSVADFFNFSVNITLGLLESGDKFVTVLTLLTTAHHEEFD